MISNDANTRQEAYLNLIETHSQIKKHLSSQSSGLCTSAIAGNYYLLMDRKESIQNKLICTSLDPRKFPIDCVDVQENTEIGDLGAEDIQKTLVEIRQWLDRPTFYPMRLATEQMT